MCKSVMRSVIILPSRTKRTRLTRIMFRPGSVSALIALQMASQVSVKHGDAVQVTVRV